MTLNELAGIPGVMIGEPKVWDDPRGFNLEIFRENVIGGQFVQAAHSHSKAGVLRGLHYHLRQADAWYVVAGEMQVVLADLRVRRDPPAVASFDLSGEKRRVLYIPPGVAHGFLAITDVDLVYWVTNYYDASDEHGVAWNDATLNVPWKTRDPILSERDQANPRLEWDSITVSS